MNKLILIIALILFAPQFLMAQTASKIAFIDWDSVRNQVDLYKINQLETEKFKAFLQEIDSLKVIQFQDLVSSYTTTYVGASCSPFSPKTQKMFDDMKLDLENQRSKIEKFEELMPKINLEFETKLKEWTDDFFKLKIRYYADLQGFKAVYSVNKLLYNSDNFNKKIIELINKDENAKEAQLYFLKFLNNKIKFDYNLD